MEAKWWWALIAMETPLIILIIVWCVTKPLSAGRKR